MIDCSLETFLDLAPAGLFELAWVDGAQDFRFIRINREGCKIIGGDYTGQLLCESIKGHRDPVPGEDFSTVEIYRQIAFGDRPPREAVLPFNSPTFGGRVYFFQRVIQLTPGRIAIGCLNITTEVKLREKLRQQATHDQLTGAYSRYYAEDQLDHACELCKQGISTTLILIDLDKFKQINDTHGHPVGDLFLQAVARCLEAQLLNTEPNQRLVARLGGEEFALLCYDLDDDQMSPILEQVREAVSQLRLEEAPQVQLTLSIGWASGRADQSLTQIFRRADQALYRAKEAGRNRVEAGDA